MGGDEPAGPYQERLPRRLPAVGAAVGRQCPAGAATILTFCGILIFALGVLNFSWPKFLQRRACNRQLILFFALFPPFHAAMCGSSCFVLQPDAACTNLGSESRGSRRSAVPCAPSPALFHCLAILPQSGGRVVSTTTRVCMLLDSGEEACRIPSHLDSLAPSARPHGAGGRGVGGVAGHLQAICVSVHAKRPPNRFVTAGPCPPNRLSNHQQRLWRVFNSEGGGGDIALWLDPSPERAQLTGPLKSFRD